MTHDIKNVEVSGETVDSTAIMDKVMQKLSDTLEKSKPKETTPSDDSLKATVSAYRSAVESAFSDLQTKKVENKRKAIAIDSLCYHLAKMGQADRMLTNLQKASTIVVDADGEEERVFDAKEIRDRFWNDDFQPLIDSESTVHPDWQFARALKKVVSGVIGGSFGYSGVKSQLLYREFAKKNGLGVKVESTPMKVTPGVSALADILQRYI